MIAIKGIASNIAENIVSTQKEINSLLQGIVIAVKTEGWVSDTDNGTYSYPVQVQGLTGEEMVSVSLYKDATTSDTAIEFYDVNIIDIETGANLLTITATAVPTEAFSIIIMGIMNVNDGIDDVKKTLEDTKTSIGDISTLDTNIGATDLVGAMNSVFQLGNENKATFVSNLKAMGIEADTTETWQALLKKQAESGAGATGSGVTVDYIAEPHDTTKEYESGDSVVYGDYLYRCKEVTSGEFDETKWEQVYLTTPCEDLVNKFNSNLSYKVSNKVSSGLGGTSSGFAKYSGTYSGKMVIISFSANNNNGTLTTADIEVSCSSGTLVDEIKVTSSNHNTAITAIYKDVKDGVISYRGLSHYSVISILCLD